MKKTLVLRTGEVKDALKLADLMGELGYPATGSEMAERVARLASSASDRIVVAEQSGRVVGMVGIHLIPLVHQAGTLARITALIVAENVRRQGVGRALLREAESWACKQGCTRVEVTSGDQRTEAHRFYEDCGYRSVSRRFIKLKSNERRECRGSEPLKV